MKPGGQSFPDREDEPRGESDSASLESGWGLETDSTENICEPLINVVKIDRRKRLLRLNQKVRGMVIVFLTHNTQSEIPPAKRRLLTCSVI